MVYQLMKGWRARIGLICPSPNTVIETEWSAEVPDGVTVHSAVMGLTKVDVDGLSDLNQGSGSYIEAAEYLSQKRVDVIVYGGTSASMLNPGLGEEIEEKIKEVTNCRGVATSAAIRRAATALSATDLAVATPYIPEVNDNIVNYLETFDYNVVDIDSLKGGIDTPSEIGLQHPEATYRQVKHDLDCSQADAVFISCTDSRTFEIIEYLEADLQLPVITSNQATLWNALREAQVDCTSIQLGELFNHQ